MLIPALFFIGDVGSIGGNPGLAALWEDERQRKRNAGQVSQITPEDSQGKRASFPFWVG